MFDKRVMRTSGPRCKKKHAAGGKRNYTRRGFVISSPRHIRVGNVDPKEGKKSG
jgi:hypothetical protein